MTANSSLSLSSASSENPSDAVAVTCENVSREYIRGSTGGLFGGSHEFPTVQALDGVSLQVSCGEFVGVAGPSGSGKSTLLHLIPALDVPTKGIVRLVGTRTSTLSARSARGEVIDRDGNIEVIITGDGTHRDRLRRQLTLEIFSGSYASPLRTNYHY